MKRRLFLTRLGLTAVALGATACGAASTSTSTSRPPVDVASDKPTLLFFFTDN